MKQGKLSQFLGNWLFFFILSLFWGSTQLSAQEEMIYVGLSDIADITEAKSIGFEPGNKLSLMQKLEQSTFRAMDNCKAIGVRFAFNTSASLNIDGLLAYDDPSKIKHISWGKSVKKGWNELLFNQPCPLPAKTDLHFGYGYTQNYDMEDDNLVLLAANEQQKNGFFIKVGSSDYFSGITQGYNNLLAQLIVKGPKALLDNAVLLIDSDMKQNPIVGEKNRIHITCRNVGLTEAKTYKIEYSVGNVKKTLLVESGEYIQKAQSQKNISIPLPEEIEIPDSSQPVDFKLAITEVNGKKNALQRELTYRLTPIKEGEVFKKIIVVEQFSTEGCSGCPKAEKTMAKAYSQYGEENMLWIVHHFGRGTDFLTLPESQKLSRFYPRNGNEIFAPALMIDRNNQLPLGKLPSPIDIFPSKVPVLVGLFNEAAKTPGYAQINEIAGNIQPGNDDDSYTIRIKGTVSGVKKDKNLRLTAILLESNIPQQNQAGLSEEEAKSFKHMFAPRKFFTDGLGTPIKLDENGQFIFEKTIKMPFVETSNCTIAVLVHEYNEKDYDNNCILNAAKYDFPSITGNRIIADKNDWIPIIVENHVMEENIPLGYSLHIHSLDGQLHPNHNLNKGYYIVTLCSEKERQKKYSYKILVQ